MPTEVKLPSLGDGIDSADVLEIFVSEGDTIAKDQGLMELETDKATVTVPSPSAGKLVKLQVKEGDTIKVGDVFALLESAGGEAKAEKPAPAPAQPEQKPAPAPQPEPQAAQPAPAPVEQPPAPKQEAPKPAPQPATPAPQPVAAVAPAQPAKAPAPVADAPSGDSIAAGPAIRRFAREVGVDLANVTGTGEYGRITREDVLAVVKRLGQHTPQATESAPTKASEPESKAATSTASASKKAQELAGTKADDDYGPIRVAKMSKIRKTIAAQMHKSWSTVPRVVNFDDADITDLEVFRQSSKDDYAAQGIKLTTMPFLIKAVATALRHHPELNATIDMENEQIIYKDYVNVGIAVDGPDGLVVPTMKTADRMSIPDIAASLADLADKVRTKSYAISDLRGGTFTISNLGAIGGTYSTPIINVPEVAILLVGRSRKLPVVMDNDKIVPRLMMPLSLAYDHRLVDGGTAGRFLNDVIELLEAPSRLLLAI